MTDPSVNATTPSASDDDRELERLRQEIEARREQARHELRKPIDGENWFEAMGRRWKAEDLAREERVDPETAARRTLADRRRREAQRQAEDESNRRHAWVTFLRDRGERYADCDLTNYQADLPRQQQVLAALRDYAADIRSRVRSGQGVVLYGSSGTGKDHLAVGLARAAIWADMKVEWSSGATIYERFRDAIEKEIPEYELIREYLRPSLLVLSDLSTGGSLTDYQQSTIYRIADRRYNSGLPVVLTINAIDREEMDRMLSPPVVDRMIDGAILVKCDWPSYRRPSAVV